MPGKTARALCPVCQEPMPPDETECANCGAFVIDEAVVRLCRAFGIDREKALALFEKGFRHPNQLADRSVDDVLTKGENGLLFLCTNCGGFVAVGDAACPRCGAEFEPEEAPVAREERDILDLVLCPVCGADNEPGREDCEICGEPFKPSAEGREPPIAVSASPVTCPTCGSPKPDPSSPCPECDRPEAPSGLTKVDAILEDLDRSFDARTPSASDAQRETASKPPAIPRRSKVPKVRRPPPPRPTPVRVTPTATRPTAARPRPKPPPTRSPSAARPRVPAPRTVVRQVRVARRRTGVPPELAGALVTASVPGLFLAERLGQPLVTWGLVGLLAAVCAVAAIQADPRRLARIGSRDALLLVAGVAPPLVTLAAPDPVAILLAVAGAIPMALATRALLRSEARMVLVAASAIPLIGFGLGAALGLGAAGLLPWDLGLLAYAPWPAALVVREMRRRYGAAALQRELLRAERDVARRDYAESLRDYDRAIALGRPGTPGEDLPWYGKGATLILLGRYEEALRAIDTALDINPRNEVAWLNKGNALMKLGRHVDALRCFNAALQVSPKYEVAWNNKGNALARMGQYDEALACYERALVIDPGYRGTWVNKGYVLTKLGRYEEAAQCADRALRLARTVAGPG